MMLPFTDLAPLLAATGGSHAVAVSGSMLSTFTGALVLGVIFTMLARRLQISAIVVLLLGGMLVGPEFLGWIRPDLLGDGLRTIVTLAVGIVLFEGGLSLDARGYRQASGEILGVLTSGVLLTWGVTAVIIHFLFPAFGWRFCLLAGSLIIVTGPTVIGPLLKRVRVRRRIHHILHWESVLIDPIGVFIALLCYEIVVLPTALNTATAFGHLILRLVVGLLIGSVGGMLLGTILRRKWVPEDSMNISALAGAVAIFGVSDILAPESGLLSVTVAGLWLGYMEIPEVRVLRRYKAELIELLIGLLFVILAARLDLDRFRELGLRGFLAVLAVIFLVRPLNIFLSTSGGTLTAREKGFLSWIAPRGIVAASMASLFVIELESMHADRAAAAGFLESFTYAVIAGTVLFQGLTARLVGRLLGVLEPTQTGWLIAGSHELARQVAAFIRNAGRHVVIVDIDVHGIAVAKRLKLPAICESALTVDFEENPELYGVGNILAVNESPDLNVRICRRYHLHQRDLNLYRWGEDQETEEQQQAEERLPGTPVWTVLSANSFKSVGSGGGTQSIERFTGPSDKLRHPDRILICLRDETLLPTLPEDAEGVIDALVYRPFNTGLDLNLRPEWIMVSHAHTMDELFGELLQGLCNEYPDLDIQTVKHQLTRQESEYSSLVGYDVALPHFHLEELKASVVLMAKLGAPLTDPHTGGRIRTVFLVLSPSSQPRTHLQALAEISRFIMDEDNRERLDAANDVNALRHVFFPQQGPTAT